MWNVNTNKETFNVIDLQPPDPEPISELLTCATFHPEHCHQLLYATSKGVTRLCDLRCRAIQDKAGVEFGPEAEPLRTPYFSEITQSILHAASAGDHQFLCRDYMTLRCWDVKMPRKPVYTLEVHPKLEQHFPRLLENESLFDHFDCAVSTNGKYFATGTYANSFFLHNTESDTQTTIQARDDSREPYVTAMGTRGGSARLNGGYTPPQHVLTFNEDDFQHNIVKVAFHPRVHALATAGLYKLYLYSPRSSAVTDLLLPDRLDSPR